MSQHTSPVLRLPILGRSGRCRRVVVGWANVPADRFCRSLCLLPWSLYRDGYPSRTNTSGVGPRTTYLHRAVFDHYHGPLPDGSEVDHIDRDKLNAMPDNLRAVVHGFNVTNTGKRRDNTSGFVGVHWARHCKRWLARINAQGKRVYLGAFVAAEDAARAVNAAYRIHHPHVPPPNAV
jgi:hypothetical protein